MTTNTSTNTGLLPTEVQLKNVRLAFPSLFAPSAFEEGQEKKYGATLLIPKDSPQIAAIKQAISAAAEGKWGKKAESILATLEGNPLKYCLNDGDAKGYSGFEGHMTLSAKNTARPTLYDRDGKTHLLESDGRPYAGCYVNAKVNFYAQDSKYGKGMRCSLAGVQFSKDGDAFTGGKVATAGEFEDLSVEAEEII